MGAGSSLGKVSPQPSAVTVASPNRSSGLNRNTRAKGSHGNQPTAAEKAQQNCKTDQSGKETYSDVLTDSSQIYEQRGSSKQRSTKFSKKEKDLEAQFNLGRRSSLSKTITSSTKAISRTNDTKLDSNKRKRSILEPGGLNPSVVAAARRGSKMPNLPIFSNTNRANDDTTEIADSFLHSRLGKIDKDIESTKESIIGLNEIYSKNLEHVKLSAPDDKRVEILRSSLAFIETQIVQNTTRLDTCLEERQGLHALLLQQQKVPDWHQASATPSKGQMTRQTEYTHRNEDSKRLPPKRKTDIEQRSQDDNEVVFF